MKEITVVAKIGWRAVLVGQGVTELPSKEAMQALVHKQHEFNKREFTQVKRHALMVRPLAVAPVRGLLSICHRTYEDMSWKI